MYTLHVDEGIIPAVSEAIKIYEANVVILTRDPIFGFDLLFRRLNVY